MCCHPHSSNKERMGPSFLPDVVGITWQVSVLALIERFETEITQRADRIIAPFAPESIGDYF